MRTRRVSTLTWRWSARYRPTSRSCRPRPSPGAPPTAVPCSSFATSCSPTGRRSCGGAGSPPRSAPTRSSGSKPQTRAPCRSWSRRRTSWSRRHRMRRSSRPCWRRWRSWRSRLPAATRGRWTVHAPRRGSRSSAATRTGASRFRASTTSAISRATPSTRSGSRSSACRGSRTSATPSTSRGV